MSQVKVLICKFNQTGFCKFKQHCEKRHVDEICGNQSECEHGTCEKRHPKICRYFSKDRKCRHGEKCSYLHAQEVYQQTTFNENMTLLMLKHEKEITALTQEVNMLKSLLQSISLQLVMTKQKEISNEDSPNMVDSKDYEDKENISTPEPSFKCDLCNYKCEKITTMNKHKNTKHESGTNENVESKSAQNNKELADSYQGKGSKGKLYCDECDFSSSNKKTFKKHKEKGHEQIECDYCKDTFTRENDMTDHINERHASIDNPSKCVFKMCTDDEVCDGCISEWQSSDKTYKK